MNALAGQPGHGPAAFLLVWGMGATVFGAAVASERGSDRLRGLVLNGLAGNPEQQARARAVPRAFVRGLGVFFAVAGLAAVLSSVAMLVRA
ncbi:hypothetical protein AB0G73_22245 [Streptomyces sp. NPDC020719]|uniref:hypothetical protein n=1 Tax=Streptomyces sp. NPDC020719 TaxID=3154896 RepID=UPI0033E4D248